MKDTATISTGEYLQLINCKKELEQLKDESTLYIEKDFMFSVGWYYKKTLEELLEQKSENKILKDKYDTAIFDLAKCRNIQSIKISLLKRVKVLFTGKY